MSENIYLCVSGCDEAAGIQFIDCLMFTQKKRTMPNIKNIYDEFANEIQFVGSILQPFQFESLSQLLKYKLNIHLARTSA